MSEIPLVCLFHCEAACCRNVSIRMSDEEADRLVRMGGDVAKLRVIPDFRGRGVWRIHDDCPYLDRNECRVHDTALKLEACKDTQPGSDFCTGKRFVTPERVKVWLYDVEGQKW